MFASAAPHTWLGCTQGAALNLAIQYAHIAAVHTCHCNYRMALVLNCLSLLHVIRNTEFLITTGPGPVPRLDGVNVVFGKVLEGIDTVRTVSTVPSFQPNARSRQLNRFAAFIGDERADNVARKYGRPLKAVVITGAGVLEGGNSSDGR